MQHIDLTSKFVLAALIATVVFSAITLPAAVAQSTSSPPIRANSVTSGSIKDGEVKTADLANNAVTSPKIADGTIQEQDIADGVIPSGGIQLDAYILSVPLSIEAGVNRGEALECETGDIVTGGGFAVPPGVVIIQNIQLDEHRWGFSATNNNGFSVDVLARATCLDLTP